MLTSASGCYEILNTVNGKRYIGSTMNLKKRWTEHRKILRGGRHNNQILQRAWNKYGEDAFKFLPILTCAPTKQMLMFYEQQLLDKVNPEYNILTTAGTCLGAKRSDASRKRMSEAHIGKPVKPRTIEQNAEISKRMLGHHRGMTGKTHTVESKSKMSEALTGKKRGPISDAHKASISAGGIGKRHTSPTPEHCIQMSEARKGVPWSPARRAAQDKKRGILTI